MAEIEDDVVAEGKRLLALASAEGVPLRLLGGVAISIRAPEEIPAALARRYADLDFATAKRAAGRASDLFRRAGYSPHVAFNALHGSERLLFFDDDHDRQVDVFVGGFSMSHAVPLADRLELEPGTVPLAELLLTKLQIAELNEKDVKDALALLLGHPVGDEDGATINAARIARVCAADWGLWRTVTGNLATVGAYIDRYELRDGEKADARARIEALLQRIEREPKTRAWSLRGRIGQRKRWYRVPAEVGGGP